MSTWPALPEEFQSALGWMEWAGERFRVLSFDKARHEVTIEKFMPDSRVYMNWVLYVDEEDIIRRRQPGRIDQRGVPVRPKNVGIQTTQKIVRKARTRRQQNFKSTLVESTPESREDMELWKQRANWLKKLRDYEDEFIKNPTPATQMKLSQVREMLNELEVDLLTRDRVVTGAE